MTVEIYAPNASAVARVFDTKRTLKALIRAANMQGKALRKELPQILAEEVGTSKAALHPRGKAAHTSQTEPAYRLRIGRRIPVSKLKANKRKLKKAGRGAAIGQLILGQPSGKTVFSRVRTEGTGRQRRFILEAVEGLPERAVGGITLSRDLRHIPRARERIGRVPAGLAKAFEEAFAAELGRSLKR